jgi:hypothetical protein
MANKPFQPLVVIYTLKGKRRTPDGQPVTKATPGAKRTRRRAKRWYGRVRRDGKLVRVRLESLTEKDAQDELDKLCGDEALKRRGLVDRYAAHNGKPIGEHIEDYRRHLKNKNNCSRHIRGTIQQIRAIVTGCRFEYLLDIEADTVSTYLADLRKQDNPPSLELERVEYPAKVLAALLDVRVASVWRMVKRGQLLCRGQKEGRSKRFLREDFEAMLSRRLGHGHSTSNHYLTAMKSFTHWLAKNRRLAQDPLFHLTKLNEEVDRRRARRAVHSDDLEKLLTAAAKGKTFRGLTGPDRVTLYTVAVQTGFRASELASLTPGSFGLESIPPTVTIRAGYSKHRREDVQPIRQDVAALVRDYLKDKPADLPL